MTISVQFKCPHCESDEVETWVAGPIDDGYIEKHVTCPLCQRNVTIGLYVTAKAKDGDVPPMLDLYRYVPHLMPALVAQLVSDQKRWGDTWKRRSREGQEVRIFESYVQYFQAWRMRGEPIPWLKVIGEALIAWVRETYWV